jgi:hypothetical protein
MDAHPVARSAARRERTTTMTEMRRCIGSERFGIEAHVAPITDFPAQPSQRDGLGRMCRTHWNAYTKALARASKERKAAATSEERSVTPTDATEPKESEAATAEESVTLADATQPAPKRRRKPAPVAEGQEAAD